MDIRHIDTSVIVAGDNGTGHQDRTAFDPAKLQDLAASMAANGLLQPISVRQIGETDLFQLVAGERRYRAALLLGWLTIPAIVLDVTADEAAALMLAENASREDLDPIDEARAYQVRIDRLGWSVADCARYAGVSEVRVQFRLKLLRLRPDLQDLVRSGQLSLGYAQILSDANLDTNRQMIAVRRLRDQVTPTPAWFRGVVNDLLAQQAQGIMFDLPLLGGPLESANRTAPALPPTPSTVKPPVTGKTAKEIVRNQATFWECAADAWLALGRPFKRQECLAAAQALSFAFESF